MKSTVANKQAAVQFLKMIIAGNIAEAYEKYIDMSGKHHNAFTPAGFSALKKGMEDAHVKFPNKQYTVLRVVGDGDLVAVHSHLVLERNTTELSVIHMFRFKDGKAVELWDIAQAISADSPNKDGLL